MHRLTNLSRGRKAASFTEYSLLVALLGAVAIGALFVMGLSVERSFDDTNTTLAAGANGNGNGNGNGPGGGNNGNGGGNGGNGACFVESGGDSTNSFNSSNTTTCFELANGADSLTTATNSPITVDVSLGDKTLTLNGSGMKTLTASDLDSLTLTATGGLSATGANVGSLTANITSNTTVSWAGNGFNSLAYTQAGTAVGSLSFGTLAAYGSSIQTGNGNQTISLAGNMPGTMRTGAGDDSFTLSGGLLEVSDGSAMHTLNMGTGTNTADIACQEQIPPDAYSAHFLNIPVEGQDVITTDRCSIQATVQDASTGDAVKSLNVVFAQPSRGDVSGNVITAHNPFSNVSVTGTSGAQTTVRVHTNPEIMQGPVNISLANTFYGSDNRHWPTVANTRPVSLLFARAEIGDGSAPTGAQPITIAFDLSAMAGQYNTGGGGRVWLTNQGPWVDATISGLDLPPTGYQLYRRSATFGLFYDGAIPGSDVVGVPVLKGANTTVNITITSVASCWNARLVDTSGVNPDMALPNACTGAGVRIIDTGSAPADTSFATDVVNLSTYNRLVLDRPGADPDLVFNYNGAPGDPGLDIAYLTINHP